MSTVFLQDKMDSSASTSRLCHKKRNVIMRFSLFLLLVVIASFFSTNTYAATSCGSLVSSIMPSGDRNHASNVNRDSVFSFDYDTRGKVGDTPDPIQLASASEVGTVWGKAYDDNTKKLYTSAFLRRHADLSPDGLGAIYEIDVSNTSSDTTIGTPSLWMNLNSTTHLGSGATLFPSETATNRNLGTPFSPSHDIWAYNRVGKQGLGGLDISDDNSTMYTVDLTNRQLLVIDIASKTVTDRHSVTNPSCANPADIRPFGVNYLEGNVYVGVTCSDETNKTGNASESAHVMRLEGSNFVDVVTGSLKGYRWTSYWEDDPSAGGCNASNKNQLIPIITNMEIDNNGNMVVGVTGVNSWRYASKNYAPIASCSSLLGDNNTIGYIIHATPTGSTWEVAATEETTDSNYQHYYKDGQYVHWGSGGSHTFMGGMAKIDCSGQEIIAANLMDPINHESAGTRYMRTADGQHETATSVGDISYATSENSTLEHYHGVGSTWEKSAGMGDLEYLSTPAPTTFTCNDDLYQSSNLSLDPSDEMGLYKINRSTSPYSMEQVGGISNKTYNALAYRTQDNYLYATHNATLLKIGSNGAISDLGIVTGLSGDQYYAGTMSTDGYYYLMGVSYEPQNSLYKIDVTTTPPQVVSTITLSRPIQLWDFSFINNHLYGIEELGSGSGKLLKIALDGTITEIGENQTGYGFGSAFSDNTGSFFAIDDNGAGFFKIDLTTGVPTKLSDGTPSRLNDGANCAAATISYLSVGDTIWHDENGDGIQNDSIDSGIEGVTVELYHPASNTILASRTSDAEGKYQFTTADGLQASTNYQLRIAKLQNKEPLSSWSLTTLQAGANPALDSDAIESGNYWLIDINSPSAGNQNTDYDFGLTNTISTGCLDTGSTGVSNESIANNHPNTYDFLFSGNLVTGFCAEKSEADPLANDNYTVNASDRQGLTAALRTKLARSYSALVDPDIVFSIASSFPSSNQQQRLDDLMQYVTHYFTDHGESRTAVNATIDSNGNYSATEKTAMKASVAKALDRVDALNGETQYPEQDIFWLWNMTDISRQDIIAPAIYAKGSSCNPTGSIVGNVYIDDNGDDSYNTGTESGIPSITITAYDDNGTSSIADDTPITTVISAADGSYSFTTLNASLTYRIEVDISDVDLPSTASIGTISPIIGISPATGSKPPVPQNFGFDVGGNICHDCNIVPPSCYAATHLLWENKPPNDFIHWGVEHKMIDGDSHIVFDAASLPSELTNPPALGTTVNLNFGSWEERTPNVDDGYQPGEQINVIFLDSSDNIIWRSNFTDDLLDTAPTSIVSSVIDQSTTVTTGVAKVLIAHKSHATYNTNLGWIGSVYPNHVCLNIESGTSNISGTVYIDNNSNDSYDSATESGINEISVSLYDDKSTASTADDSFISTTTSTTNGSYSFNNLNGSTTYRIEVDVTDSNLPENSTIGTSNPLTGVIVSAGNTTTGQNFGFDNINYCPGNLLLNGSFEQPGVTEQSATSWTGGETTNSSSMIKPHGNFYAAESAGKAFYQDISVTSGNAYQLTFYAATHDPNLEHNFVHLQYLNAANNLISQVTHKVIHDADTGNLGSEQSLSLPSSPSTAAKVRVSMETLSGYTKVDAMCLQKEVALREISGSVFEDTNYGGGSGRSLGTTGALLTEAGSIELYDAFGNFVSSVSTTNGTYSLLGLSDGNYYVRVVNQSVSSARTGSNGLVLGVQTYRSNGTTETTNEVGGRNPAVVDASTNNDSSRLNTSTFLFETGTLNGQQAQTVQPITLSGSTISSVDFGFNFSTVVNELDSGQGSFRQFIFNSNLLDNTSLQQALPASIAGDYTLAGYNVSIFMIPATNLSSGSAIIPIEEHISITSQKTAIDGRTQALNIGSGEIVIDGQNNPLDRDGLQFEATADYSVIRNITVQNVGGIGVVSVGTSSNPMEGLLIESNTIHHNGYASSAKPGIRSYYTNGSVINSNTITDNNSDGIVLFIDHNNNTISNNVITQNENAAISLERRVNSTTINNNTITNNVGFGMYIRDDSKDNTITENTITNNGVSNGGIGIQVVDSDDNSFVGNTITGQGSTGLHLAGTTSGSTVTINNISNNGNHGVFIQNNAANNSITENTLANNSGAGIKNEAQSGNSFLQNSIYSNLGLGIDLDITGVTLNDVGDADNGPNDLLNFPEITSAVTNNNTINFDLDVPAGSYHIEFFSNSLGADSSGHGEGQTFIDSLLINHIGGKISYSEVISGLTVDSAISATTTEDNGNNNYGSTSEFSGISTALLETDLRLEKHLKTGQNQTVNPGDTVTFTLRVINESTVDVTNVQLVDYMPGTLTLNDADWTATGSKVTLNTPIATLAAGASTEVDIQFIANSSVIQRNNTETRIGGIQVTDDTECRNNAEITAFEGGTDKDSIPDNILGNDGYEDDHSYTTFNIAGLCSSPYDFGDAPDPDEETGKNNYQTLDNGGGPRHVVSALLYMGNCVDTDVGNQQNISADADDNSVSNHLTIGTCDIANDDEDGLVPPIFADAEVEPKVFVRVNNTSGQNATLSCWADYNGDGIFDNASERGQVTDITSQASSQLISVTMPDVPLTAGNDTQGKSYLRCRVASGNGADNPIGSAANGEVEDYEILIEPHCTVSANLDTPRCSSDNNTVDPSDDTWEFDVNVTSTGVGSSPTWKVTGDLNQNNRLYNQFETLAVGKISDTPVIDLVFSDEVNTICRTEKQVSAPLSCSPSCNFSLTKSNVTRNCQGTPSEDDDTLSVVMDFTGSNSDWEAFRETSGSPVSLGTFTGNQTQTFNFNVSDIVANDPTGFTLSARENTYSDCADSTFISLPSCAVLPQLTIADQAIIEGNSGKSSLEFTVALGDSTALAKNAPTTRENETCTTLTFDEKFNSGMQSISTWEAVNLTSDACTWSVENNELKEITDILYTGCKGFLLPPLDSSTYNASSNIYDLEVTIKPNYNNTVDNFPKDNNGVGLVFGYQDQNNYYLARWLDYGHIYEHLSSYHYRYLQLIKVSNGVETIVDEVYAEDLSENFKLEVQVNDAGTKILIDNTLYIESNSEQPVINQFGVYTIDNDDGIFYDNLKADTYCPSDSVNHCNDGKGNDQFNNPHCIADSSEQVTLDYTVSDDTASRSDNDYEALNSGSVTVFAGESTARVSVEINGDTKVEPDETFTINLSNVLNAQAVNTLATGTIINDDVPTISITDSSVTEGDNGTKNIDFTVSLDSPAPSGGIAFDYATTDGTATLANNDYQSTAGIFTIPEGNTTGTLSVVIVGDTDVETDETFLINLSNPVNSLITDNQIQGTIINDDLADISISNSSTIEGNSGITDLDFTVTLSQAAPAGGVSVDYITTDGTATTSDNDYQNATGTLTIPQGSTTGTITIGVIGDIAVEADETFTVTLLNVVNGNLVGTQAQGTIINDDILSCSANATIWVVDEASEEADPHHLWSFDNLDSNLAGTDHGTLTWKHPVDNTIHALGEAKDMEAMASNIYTGQIYLLSSSDTDDGPGSSQALWTYNLNNINADSGNVVLTLLGHIDRITSYSAESMAFDPATKRLYIGAPTDNGQNNSTVADQLYYIDVTLLAANPLDKTTPTFIGNVQGAGESNNYIDSMEFDNSGNLYTSDGTDQHIYKIDPSTGAILSVVNSNILADTGDPDIESLSWDQLNNRMIAIDNRDLRFIDVSLSNGNNTVISTFGDVSGVPSSVDFESSVMFLNCDAAKVGIGNTVFIDNNQNGVFDVGEGVDGVTVQLFTEGDNPATAISLNETVTSGGGLYQFTGLVEDKYFVHIPSSMFAASKPLEGLSSITGNGTDNGIDDDADENGIDTATLTTSGISSATIDLQVSTEAVDSGTETGNNNSDDNVLDSNNDWTVDFGFVLPVIEPNISIADSSVTEGNSGTKDLNFTVSLSDPAPVGGVSIDYVTSDGTATTANNDYQSTSSTLTIPAGNTTGTISIVIVGDTDVEADETFTITLSNAINGTISDTQATGTIVNDDVAVAFPSVSAEYRFDECSWDGSASEVLDNTSHANHGMALSSANTLADAVLGRSGDFSGSNKVEMNNAPQITVGDSNADFAVTFWMRLDQGSTGSWRSILQKGEGGQRTFALWMRPSDNRVHYRISTTSSWNSGGDSVAAIALNTWTHIAYVKEGNQLHFYINGVKDSTANLPSNVISNNGDLRIGSNYNNTGIDAGIDEFKVFDNALSLSDVQTIYNNENSGLNYDGSSRTTPNCGGSPVDISSSASSTLEGHSGTKTLDFTITLSAAASSGGVSLDYSTTDGTATTANNDYQSASGTLTIPQGSTTGTISVTIVGDTDIEADETFTITLSNAINGTISDTQATGTIVNDDGSVLSNCAQILTVDQTNLLPTNITSCITAPKNDPTPNISIADSSVTEGDSGTKDLSFTVNLSGSAPVGDVSIDYVTSDGTATTANIDYQSTSGTLTIPTGSTTGTISVVIVGDTNVETDETFTITLSNAINGTISDTQATGTIVNDDVAVAFPSVSAEYRFDECSWDGSASEVLDNTSHANHGMALSSANTLADAVLGRSGDFSGSNKVEMNNAPQITVGNSNADFAVTFWMRLDQGSTGSWRSILQKGEGGQRTFALWMRPSDNRVHYRISTTSSWNSGGDSVAAIALNTWTHIAYVKEGNQLHFYINGVKDSTANLPSDVISNNGDLRIGSNYNNTGIDAGIDEFKVFDNALSLTDVQTIYNNENSGLNYDGSSRTTPSCGAPADISISDGSTLEGHSGTKTLDFTVTLSAAAPSGGVSFDYSTTDGTATTANNDYQNASGTLTIPQGSTTGTISVTVVGDTDMESDETFTLNLSNPANGVLLSTQVTGTIINDDGDTISNCLQLISVDQASAFPSVASSCVTIPRNIPSAKASISDASITEGDSGTKNLDFIVTLSAIAPAGGVSLDYSTSNSTATTSNSDYQAKIETLAIPEGATSGTISILVNGDTNIEMDETLLLNLSNPTNTVISDGQAIGTIINDDFNADCNTGSGDFGGTVFSDFNANGLQDIGDTGISGITITAYSTNNTVAASSLSNNTGSYVLSGLNNDSQYRLEFTGMSEAVQPTSGSNSGSTVQFITAGAGCTTNLGLSSTIEYCQAIPDLITTRQVNGDGQASGASANIETLVRFPYSAKGKDPKTENIYLSTNVQTGAVWGMAFQKKTQTVFTSAFLKRHVGFGSLGTGGIYTADPATNTTSSWIDVRTIGIDTGSDTRNGTAANSLPAAANQPNYDVLAFSEAGKRSIGDIDFDADENTLWLVNLNDRSLYGIQNVDPASTPTVADVHGGYIIEHPSITCNQGILRPWGVKVHDDKIYVGAVCSGESNASASETDLAAHILSFDPNTELFTPVTSVNLDYTRRYLGSDTWTGTWSTWHEANTANNADILDLVGLPTPILSDIEFDTSGAIILGIMDRFSLMRGQSNYLPDSSISNTQLVAVDALAVGDIIRLCQADNGYALEGSADCPSPTTGLSYGINNGEYYSGDYGPDATAFAETINGGLALFPHTNEILASASDATDWYQSGIIWLDNTSGNYAGGYDIVGADLATEDINNDGHPDTDDPTFFHKGAGIGDIELLCDEAPIEIGNYVWNDSDSDGIQDADESGISGVDVQLLCGLDSTIVTTNSAGQYSFSNKSGGNASFMDTGESCALRIDTTQGGLAGGSITTVNADGISSNSSQTDIRDSDASINGSSAEINFIVGSIGQNNHSLDIGFTGISTISLPQAAADYRFDECAWTDAANEVIDSSGNNLHAQSSLGARIVSSGKFYRAGDFDGSNDVVTIPNDSQLQLTEDLSLSFWVNPDVLSGRQGIIFKHYNNEYEIILESSGVMSFYHGDGSWEEITEPSASSISANVWSHITITRDHSTKTLKWYVNGVFKGSDTYVENPLASNNNIQIGKRSNTQAFNGQLDEVKFFNQTLSDDEILTIYDNENAGRNYDGSTRASVSCSLSSTLRATAASTVETTETGLLSWRSVWINEGISASPYVEITAEIPQGTLFVPLPAGEYVSANGIYCEARGISAEEESCFYESPTTEFPQGRVVWRGIISPEAETSEVRNMRTSAITKTSELIDLETIAENEVVLNFTTVPTGGQALITGQAYSDWYFNGVNSDTPDTRIYTFDPRAETPETPPKTTIDPSLYEKLSTMQAIPTVGEWSLIIMTLLLSIAGMFYRRRYP